MLSLFYFQMNIEKKGMAWKRDDKKVLESMDVVGRYWIWLLVYIHSLILACATKEQQPVLAAISRDVLMKSRIDLLNIVIAP